MWNIIKYLLKKILDLLFVIPFSAILFTVLIFGLTALLFINFIHSSEATTKQVLLTWMAAAGGCGFVLLYFFSKNRKLKTFIVYNKTKSTLIASVILLSIVSVGYSAYQLKKDSADGRALIWKNTFELIRQNPMGVGLGNYSGSYGHIQAAYFAAGKATEDEARVAGN